MCVHVPRKFGEFDAPRHDADDVGADVPGDVLISVVATPQLRKLVRAMASRINPTIADDLAQEGWLALIIAASSWDSKRGASLWTYARQAVWAAMVKHARDVRKHIADETLPLDNRFGQGVGIYGVPVGNKIVAIAVARLCANDIVEADRRDSACWLLDSLTEPEQKVVKSWLGGSTFEEIASKNQTSRRSIKRVFDNAIATLRERAA